MGIVANVGVSPMPISFFNERIGMRGLGNGIRRVPEPILKIGNIGIGNIFTLATFFPPRYLPLLSLPLFTFLFSLFTFFLLPRPSPATGWVERTPDALTVHLTLFDLPDPARTDPATRAELAVQREYLRLVPGRLAARAAARGTPLPADAPPLRVQLHRFSGIQVEGVESPLLALAGNVAPDVLYVNFRQSQTYIDQGFLAPLDDPADSWFTAFSPSEIARRVHPAIDPVIRRPGPGGDTHVWALPSGPPLSRVVLFRRDLFDAAGLPPPSPSWTWDDFLADCRALADPARGVYAIGLSRGKHESYLWLPFLRGAGGEALAWDPAAARWNAVFDTPEAAFEEAVAAFRKIAACPEASE